MPATTAVKPKPKAAPHVTAPRGQAVKRKPIFKIEIEGKKSGSLNLQIGIANIGLALYTPYNEVTSKSHKGCPQLNEDGSLCGHQLFQPPRCDVHELVPEHMTPVKIIVEGDQTILVTEEDLAMLDMETNGVFELNSVVKAKEMEYLAVFSESTRQLVPEEANDATLYELLVKSLKKTNSVIVGKYCLSRQGSREKIGIIRPHEHTLIIQSIPFFANKRALPVIPDQKTSAEHVDMMTQILAAQPTEFVYNEVVDVYDEAFQTLVADKVRENLGQEKKGRKKERVVLGAKSDSILDMVAQMASEVKKKTKK